MTAAVVAGLVVVAVGFVVAGVIVCHGFGHAPRPRPRTRLRAREQSEIAIVASRWSALPHEEQGDALARLLSGAAAHNRVFGALVRDLAASAVDERERSR